MQAGWSPSVSRAFLCCQIEKTVDELNRATRLHTARHIALCQMLVFQTYRRMGKNALFFQHPQALAAVASAPAHLKIGSASWQQHSFRLRWYAVCESGNRGAARIMSFVQPAQHWLRSRGFGALRVTPRGRQQVGSGAHHQTVSATTISVRCGGTYVRSDS